MEQLTKVILTMVMMLIPILAVYNVDAKGSQNHGKETSSVQLFIALPTEYNTPDGAALGIDGNIILSIPNFNNDALLKDGKINQPSPPVMAIINQNNEISTWYTFKKEDFHPETGRIGPMDAAFGPDGNLYCSRYADLLEW